MRRTTTGWTSGTTRLAAAALLVGVFVVLPVLVWRGIGGVGTEGAGVSWSTVFRSGRVDGDTVVAAGLIVFTALWAWFALTAMSEAARVVTWRHRPIAALPPLPASPTGVIRRLVRAALVSTSTVVGAGLVSLTGSAGVGAAALVPVAAVAAVVGPDASIVRTMTDPIHGHHRAAPAEVRSSGRDTPYSIAVRLGDAQLRDRIIELNHGALAPDGTTWTGGVFPAGMTVTVPEGLLSVGPTVWTPYLVEEGDSVYRIATRLADGDNRRVRDLADAIIERNLGRVMADGRVFDDPSLVRIGWTLDVPGTGSEGAVEGAAGTAPVWGATHLVTPGESYWSIAEQHVDPPGGPADVAELTDELVEHNAPLLGHDRPTMLHPGDPVELPITADATRPVEAAAPVEPMDLLPDAIDAGPSPVLQLPDSAEAPEALEAPGAPGAPVATPTTDAPVSAATEADPRPAPNAAQPVDVGTVRSPVTTSLAAAVLLCAGALGLVESRRRQQLRRAGTDALAPTPSAREVEIERLVRSLDATQRAVRLDLALRAAGHALVGTGGFVLAAIVTDDGAVTVVLDRPGRVPVAPWCEGVAADRWTVPATVGNDELAPLSRLAGQPCPAVVHLGRLVGDAADPLSAGNGELFIDLEAFGLVCIDDERGDASNHDGPNHDGPNHDDPVRATDSADARASGDAVLRAIATSLAASPVGETLRLITHELDPAVHLGNHNAEQARDFDSALDLAASALGSTPTAVGHRRTSELRARGIGGEAWEPVVVVSAAATHEPAVLRELCDVTRGGGRGLAVVLRHAVEGASLTVRATRHGWVMDRLGLTVVPVGLAPCHVADLRRLLGAADQPVVELPPRPRRTAPVDPFVEPSWTFLVRVLGGIDVVDHSGTVVAFDRGKSLELVAWLAQHRDHPTRGGARAALWELEVRDATFANVVSDARRSLARAVPPADGEEWVARTLTDHLPLHPRVLTDADLLRQRLDDSRDREPHQAIEVLRPGVALIRDLPFAGTDFLWPHAEGLTSSLTLLATTAATELARHHLAVGDVDGVFWATGQGLRALPGHEELIGLRMRAHAQRGDLAGVRQEWEGYERAIVTDAWSDGEPSPKLLALRRELLSS
jgi:hypothetical protein